jgi:hypothetical protein
MLGEDTPQTMTAAQMKAELSWSAIEQAYPPEPGGRSQESIADVNSAAWTLGQAV